MSPGFMQFLVAALDPLHHEHNEVVTWYGKPFDPVDIDERWVRLRLATLAARRQGALERGIEPQHRQIRPDCPSSPWEATVPRWPGQGRRRDRCRARGRLS